jgi:hypothetical protein
MKPRSKQVWNANVRRIVLSVVKSAITLIDRVFWRTNGASLG